MDMISFKEEVLRLIAFWQEGEYWDFKKEWHKNKSDLLVAKLWGVGMKRAKTLITAAEHSVGSKEAPETARIELRHLLGDMDVYTSRLEELLRSIEGKLREIPYVDKLMEIKGIGLTTVSGFIAEVGDIGYTDTENSLHGLAGR